MNDLVEVIYGSACLVDCQCGDGMMGVGTPWEVYEDMKRENWTFPNGFDLTTSEYGAKVLLGMCPTCSIQEARA